MPALMIDRQTKRDLPTADPTPRNPSPAHPRRRFQCCNSSTLADNDGAIDERPHPLRIALGEVLITHDPITVL
jgi:hypothetical protein